MLSIKKILIPIDGSESSMEALRYASSFAGEFNITVYLMTVVEPHHGMYDAYAEQIILAQRETEIMAVVNERLEETEKKAAEMGIKTIITVTRVGSPYEQIIKLAEEEEIDLIVMGTHGRSGIAHFLIGSVTEKVIRTSPCPVLVIRPHLHGLINKNTSSH